MGKINPLFDTVVFLPTMRKMCMRCVYVVFALFPFRAIRIFRFKLRTKSNRKVTIRLLDSIAKGSSKRMHIDFDEGNSLRWRFFLCFIHIEVNAFFCVFLVVGAQPQDT